MVMQTATKRREPDAPVRGAGKHAIFRTPPFLPSALLAPPVLRSPEVVQILQMIGKTGSRP